VSLPILPVTTVGSWPRPPVVGEAIRAYRHRRIASAERDRVIDEAVVELLRLQEALGCDILTDGELRRDNFYSFVAEKLSGVRLMTLAEMLDVVEDKAGFEQLLQTLDVPAYSISSPVCTGRVERRERLTVDDLAFARRHTDRPVKVTLPGPYLLTRAMFVPELTRAWYADKEALAPDVVSLLSAEIDELRAAGAAFVQIDEPVLTEVAFAPGRTRTFMCAALAARRDPAEELEFAVSLINDVVEGFDDVRIGVHICRGNWSRDERTLLTGSYESLRPYLERLRVKQLVLEYATERAGSLVEFAGKELGLGVVNPRTDHVETPADVRRTIERALELYPADRIFLNPDCGFGTFSNRPMNSREIACAKIESMVAAARALRS
jgi:5-methyltetrahydropteroyltriglutamate--homocysteine methyltransferase